MCVGLNQSAESLHGTKKLIVPEYEGILPEDLQSGTSAFSLPAALNWIIRSSWVSGLPAFVLELYHRLFWLQLADLPCTSGIYQSPWLCEPVPYNKPCVCVCVCVCVSSHWFRFSEDREQPIKTKENQGPPSQPSSDKVKSAQCWCFQSPQGKTRPLVNNLQFNY